MHRAPRCTLIVRVIAFIESCFAEAMGAHSSALRLKIEYLCTFPQMERFRSVLQPCGCTSLLERCFDALTVDSRTLVLWARARSVHIDG